ncbi:MAG: hypothetical protein AB7S59_17060, partial [Parvibaculaceae bacterium]
MTDEEFARLYPNANWQPSTGSYRSYVPTPRDRLADALYGIYGNSPEAQSRVTNLMNYADFLGGGLFGLYDASRAAAERRVKDAAWSGVAAAAPFVIGRPTRSLLNTVRRRQAGRAFDDYAAIMRARGNGHDTRDIYDIDFTVPTRPGERSSPWIAPYPPLPRRPRHFSQDYPHGAPVDAAGNFLVDKHGNPLTAEHVLGWKNIYAAPQHLSEDDLYSFLNRNLDATLLSVPPSELRPGTLAQTYMQEPPIVKFWGDMPQDQINTTLAHELGHLVDQKAGLISTEGLEDELNRLYSELSTGRKGPPFLSPEMRGYSDFMAPREKIAEAIRAYSDDSNMIKEVAPKTAERLQKLNPHPWFAKNLQFNSIPLGAAAGAGVAVTGQDNSAQALTPPMSPHKIAPSYARR